MKMNRLNPNQLSWKKNTINSIIFCGKKWIDSRVLTQSSWLAYKSGCNTRKGHQRSSNVTRLTVNTPCSMKAIDVAMVSMCPTLYDHNTLTHMHHSIMFTLHTCDFHASWPSVTSRWPCLVWRLFSCSTLPRHIKTLRLSLRLVQILDPFESPTSTVID